MDIYSRLNKQTLVLDGAMGTMIMKANLEEKDFRGKDFISHPVALKGCNDILCLTAPDVISHIHKEYLKAGADIISTNSFNANSLSLTEYQVADKVADICQAAVKIARKTVDDFCLQNNIYPEDRPFVAGSMGPTGMSLSINMQDSEDPAADFEMMANAYSEQAENLITAGADLLLLETVFDTLNAKAAIYGIKEAFERTGKIIPISISATIDEKGNLLSGQNLHQFVEALQHAEPLSFGLNCGFGAKALLPYLKELSELPLLKNTFISVHPNAGLPDEMGNYVDTPPIMESEIREILQQSLTNIIGGCCGTTPSHIRLIAKAAKEYPIRTLSKAATCDAEPFIKVGERCNVAGSRKFLRLVSERNWKDCLDIAAAQIEKGAKVLDINMDDALLDASSCMCSFITRLYSDRRTASMALMIDSSDFSVCEKAMRLLPIKGIVNSISLKNGEEEFLTRAKEIKSLGCSMVVMAFDEKGQADTFERKIEICSRAYSLLVEKADVNPSGIIFDPNVLAVSTGIKEHDSYALDFICATEWIKHNLPGAKVSGGVSNLSFSFRGIDPVRKAMHTVFLEQNIKKGMDMAIINPSTPLESTWINDELKELATDVILNNKPNASESLLDYAMQLKRRMDEEKAAKKRDIPKRIDDNEGLTNITASKRLSDAIINGDSESLEILIESSLKEHNGSAMSVVENGLMKGMDIVGDRFGAGEMFLPQVVRSASVMKKAFDILTPLIESQQNELGSSDDVSRRPLVVIATVKGDVHDIGKNIVGVVLRCGGYEVEDLGVMVAPETIVEKAISLNASAIGLSGLITPSLHEMGVVASMMEAKGLDIPLFVGGATTSDIHTAVKLAPLYSGAVVHTSDAASLPKAIKDFISESSLDAMESLRKKQHVLRDKYESFSEILSLEEARKKAKRISSPAPSPNRKGVVNFFIPFSYLRELINWRAFLSEWKLNSAKAIEIKNMIMEGRSDDSEEFRLTKDALSTLNSLHGTAKAKVVIVSATSKGDDIIIENSIKLPTIRSNKVNPISGTTLALSDFIYPEGDTIGIFTVTLAGSGLPERIEDLKSKDHYKALLLQSLSHRLAEAATEWTHIQVSKLIWNHENKIGIRPAVGYSSLPDQSLVFILDKILDYASLGVDLTPHGALSPSATTTGLIIPHTDARYFEVGQLSEEWATDYINRRGLTADQANIFIRQE